MHGELAVGGVDGSLDDVAAQVTRADDVPVGVLVNVEIALVLDAHHDQLVV
jgi:hypothetical protein